MPINSNNYNPLQDYVSLGANPPMTSDGVIVDGVYAFTGVIDALQTPETTAYQDPVTNQTTSTSQVSVTQTNSNTPWISPLVDDVYTQGYTLDFSFNQITYINQISFDILNVPCTWTLTQSGTYNSSLYTGVVTGLDGTWVPTIVDLPETYYFDANTNLYLTITKLTNGLTYTLGVQNLLTKLLVENNSDLKVNNTTISGFTVQNRLGFIENYSLANYGVSYINDSNSTTYWKCSPQPVGDAVVYFIVDLGYQQTVNKIFIDPLYSGTIMNLYYSNDCVNWAPVNQDFTLRRGIYDLLPINARYIKFEFTQLIPEPYNLVVDSIQHTVSVFPDSIDDHFIQLESTVLDTPSQGYLPNTTNPASNVTFNTNPSIPTNYGLAVGQLGGDTYGGTPSIATGSLGSANYGAGSTYYTITDPTVSYKTLQDVANIGSVFANVDGSILMNRRFDSYGPHIYKQVVVNQTWHEAYFTGIRSLNFYCLNPLIQNDNEDFTDSFYSTILPASTYDANVEALNPQGYWKLSDAVGTTSVANSAFGNTTYSGTIHNKIYFGQNPIISGIYPPQTTALFSGYMTTSQSGNNTTNGFSITGWFNPVTLPGGIVTLAGIYNYTASNGFYMTVNNVVGSGISQMLLSIAASGGGSGHYNNLVHLTNYTALSGWHMYAATYDTTTSGAAIYIDGVKVGSHTGWPYVVASGATFQLGGSNNFVSYAAEVAWFNYALSSGQIYNLYSSVSGIYQNALPSPSTLIDSTNSTASLLTGGGYTGLAGNSIQTQAIQTVNQFNQFYFGALNTPWQPFLTPTQTLLQGLPATTGVTVSGATLSVNTTSSGYGIYTMTNSSGISSLNSTIGGGANLMTPAMASWTAGGWSGGPNVTGNSTVVSGLSIVQIPYFTNSSDSGAYGNSPLGDATYGGDPSFSNQVNNYEFLLTVSGSGAINYNVNYLTPSGILVTNNSTILQLTSGVVISGFSSQPAGSSQVQFRLTTSGSLTLSQAGFFANSTPSWISPLNTSNMRMSAVSRIYLPNTNNGTYTCQLWAVGDTQPLAQKSYSNIPVQTWVDIEVPFTLVSGQTYTQFYTVLQQTYGANETYQCAMLGMFYNPVSYQFSIDNSNWYPITIGVGDPNTLINTPSATQSLYVKGTFVEDNTVINAIDIIPVYTQTPYYSDTPINYLSTPKVNQLPGKSSVHQKPLFQMSTDLYPPQYAIGQVMGITNQFALD